MEQEDGFIHLRRGSIALIEPSPLERVVEAGVEAEAVGVGPEEPAALKLLEGVEALQIQRLLTVFL